MLIRMNLCSLSPNLFISSTIIYALFCHPISYLTLVFEDFSGICLFAVVLRAHKEG